MTWASGRPIPEDVICRDKMGVVRLVIEADGILTVMAGYAWNGCSPKWCFLDLCWGTPDGVVSERTGRPKTWFASLFHDALCQFLPDGLPYSRRQTSAMFYELLRESEFALRWPYWAAVWLFGEVVRVITRWHRQLHGTTTRFSELYRL